jgi:hypothetical protein
MVVGGGERLTYETPTSVLLATDLPTHFVAAKDPPHPRVTIARESTLRG